MKLPNVLPAPLLYNLHITVVIPSPLLPEETSLSPLHPALLLLHHSLSPTVALPLHSLSIPLQLVLKMLSLSKKMVLIPLPLMKLVTLLPLEISLSPVQPPSQRVLVLFLLMATPLLLARTPYLLVLVLHLLAVRLE